jgi:hypothetical protein
VRNLHAGFFYCVHYLRNGFVRSLSVNKIGDVSVLGAALATNTALKTLK